MKSRKIITVNTELVSIEEAVNQLGKGYSRSSILRRINSGGWLEGTHWVDARRQGGPYRIIKINLKAVCEELATPAAFR